MLAMIAASAALTLSGVPFMGPIGAARVGFTEGEYILNPTQAQIAEGRLDLVVAGTRDAVMMVESEAKELSEEEMLGAVMFAHRESQKVIEAIIKLAEQAAKEPWELAPAPTRTRSRASSRSLIGKDIEAAYKLTDKQERSDRARRSARQGRRSVRRSRPAGAARRRQAGQEPRGRRRPRRDPQGRPPNRRPRHQDGAPDRNHASASCRAPTVRRCSPAAKPRRSSRPRSAPRNPSR